MASATKVLVLGGNGMLGSMVRDLLDRNPGLDVSVTSTHLDPECAAGGPTTHAFDAVGGDLAALLEKDDFAWIVNAIGVIKPNIDETDAAALARAIDLNAAFPFRLAAGAATRGQRIIQIATDGVFAGADGPYDEAAPHDAHDVYGKSKSLGEVPAPNVLHIRCSIVGDPRASNSLLGWALGQPVGSILPGFTNHRWNGVTTWHFAKVCEGVIAEGTDGLPSPLHLVPADSVSKAELLELVVAAFKRSDLTVSPGPAEIAIDRTLKTCHSSANARLWAAAGHQQPPTIGEMVETLASYLRQTPDFPHSP